MEMLPEELRKLRESDPDLAQVLDAFARLDSVYRGALKAMGAIPEQSFRVANSAEVTVSFDPSGPGGSPTIDVCINNVLNSPVEVPHAPTGESG